jgi:hypothetical protein
MNGGAVIECHHLSRIVKTVGRIVRVVGTIVAIIASGCFAFKSIDGMIVFLL